jgi:hypothetical protein
MIPATGRGNSSSLLLLTALIPPFVLMIRLTARQIALSVTPTAVGTYTYTITPTGGANTTVLTWTVVVEARPALTAAASTAYNNYAYYNDAANVAARGAWATWSTTTDALTLNAYANPSDAPSAAIKVVQANGNTTFPLIAADAVALTVTATGPAVVAISGEGGSYAGNLGAKGIYAIYCIIEAAILNQLHRSLLLNKFIQYS